MRLPTRKFQVADSNVHKPEDDDAGFKGFDMTGLALKAIWTVDG